MSGYKPKDLIGLPWMLAFALRNGGWYLRSEIIWHKPSPMPESVRDRPTRAHDQIFLLSKSTKYFYDAREAQTATSHRRTLPRKISEDGRSRSSASFYKATLAAEMPNGRNLRDVWTLSPQGFSASKVEGYAGPAAAEHYAVFPPSLPERCIKAGTSEKGVCGECGAPWVRQVDRIDTGLKQKMGDNWDTGAGAYGPCAFYDVSANRTTGWSASCPHDAPPVPATVLDPFLGSGTTLMVANRLGRNGIGIELSPQYAALARQRIKADAPLLAP